MNNTGILQKCVDELNKEGFRKDYVLGLLEALIETSEPKRGFVHPKDIDVNAVIKEYQGEPADDEAAILDGKARAAIAAVQAMASESNVG